jgi:hypothetical protein
MYKLKKNYVITFAGVDYLDCVVDVGSPLAAAGEREMICSTLRRLGVQKIPRRPAKEEGTKRRAACRRPSR